MAEEDHGRRQPRPVLVGHDVAVAVVLPQLVGCGGHVKVDVAVNQSQQTVTSKQTVSHQLFMYKSVHQSWTRPWPLKADF